MKKSLKMRIMSGLTALCMVFSYTLAEPLMVMAEDLSEGEQTVLDTADGDEDISAPSDEYASDENAYDEAEADEEDGLIEDDIVRDAGVYNEIGDLAGLEDAFGQQRTGEVKFKLTADITIISGHKLEVLQENYIILDLNGHDIINNVSGQAAITVKGHLTLENTNSDNTGRITSEDNITGSGVDIESGGVFIMRGGIISGNSAAYGGGVYVGDGIFYMRGGTIYGNRATQQGGGVYVNTADISGCYFYMYDGIIFGNAAQQGGGVYVVGSSKGGTILQGTITRNSANIGGGVYLSKHTTVFISQNTVDGLDAVNITNNELSGSEAHGADVYLCQSKVKLKEAVQIGEMYFEDDMLAADVDMSELGEDSDIGISSATTPDYSNPVAFAYSSEDVTGYLTTKVEDTEIEYDQVSGTISLVKPEHWGGLKAMIEGYTGEGAQSFTLDQDYTADEGAVPIVVDHDVTIDLNGRTIDRGLADAEASAYGGIFIITENGSLTINDSSNGDGLITGANTTRDGGAVCSNGGSFTLNSGTISGNKARDGGAVALLDSLLDYSTITVKGGTITGNSASENGDGIYIAESGASLISAGAITDNGEDGTDLYLVDASLSLSGAPVIGRMFVTNKQVYYKIDASGLTEGAQIGIKTETAPEDTDAGCVYFAYSDTDTSQYFKRSNSYEKIEYNVVNNGLYLDAVNAWNDLQSQIEQGGTITLDADYTATPGDNAHLLVSEDTEVTIDLNGHTIDRGLSAGTAQIDGAVFIVAGKLTIKDSAGGGKITGANCASGAVVVASNTTFEPEFILEGGTITGNHVGSNAAAVEVMNGRFTMTGGSIVNNNDGKDVRVEDGASLTLSGTPEIGDLFIPADSTATITAADLGGEYTSIGVSSAVAPTVDTSIVIADSVNDTSAYFHSLSNKYAIEWEGEKVLLVSTDNWNRLQNQMNEGGTIVLTEDIREITAESSTHLIVKKDVTIDLHGHNIIRYVSGPSASGDVFYIEDGATLTITDSTTEPGMITGGWSNYGGAVTVRNGTFVLSGGNIEQNTGAYGTIALRPLANSDRAVFTMTGGKIRNNIIPSDCGSVYIGSTNATATITGGTIYNSNEDHDNIDIWYASGALNLSGAPNIGKLHIMGTALTEDSAMTVGDLGEIVPIEVSYGGDFTGEAPVVFASSATDTHDSFTSAVENTAITWSDGKLAFTSTKTLKDEVEWEWNESYNDATVRLRYTDDTVYWEERADVEAAYVDGKVVFTAAAEHDGEEYTNSVTGDVIWDWSDDLGSVSVRIEVDNTIIWTDTGSDYLNITKACSQEAVTYTATGEYRDLAITDAVDANISWDWEEDLSAATITCTYNSNVLWSGTVTNIAKGYSDEAVTYSATYEHDDYAFTDTRSKPTVIIWKWSADWSECTAYLYEEGTVTGTVAPIWTKAATISESFKNDVHVVTAKVTSGTNVFTDEKTGALTWVWDGVTSAQATFTAVGGSEDGKVLWTQDAVITATEIRTDRIRYNASVSKYGSLILKFKYVDLTEEWSEDLSTLTLICTPDGGGEELWRQTSDNVVPTIEENDIIYLEAKITLYDTELEYGQSFEAEHITASEPSVDSDGVYRSGAYEHYVFTDMNGNVKYLYPDGGFTRAEDVTKDTFTFSDNAVTGYVGSFEDVQVIIIPAYYVSGTTIPEPEEDTEGTDGDTEGTDDTEEDEDPQPVEVRTAVTAIGSGEGAFFSMTDAATYTPEFFDSGTITSINAKAFEGCYNFHLTLSANEVITVAEDAFDEGNADNITIYAFRASGLASTDRYTVVYIGEIPYEVTAEWADDYSTATLTLTHEDYDTIVIPAEDVTVTKQMNEDHTFDITASAEQDGIPYSAALKNVQSYKATVNSTDYYVPVANGKDYAVFTVTADMLSGIDVPAGAEAVSVSSYSITAYIGKAVNLTADTVFTDVGYRSVWAYVENALKTNSYVKLYSNITAGEGDGPLVIGPGTVTLDLNGYTIDRALSEKIENGYVIYASSNFTLTSGGSGVESDDTTGLEGIEIVDKPLVFEEARGVVTGGKNIGNGGGLFVAEGGNVTVKNVDLLSNQALNGGGAYTWKDTAFTILHSDVKYNRAEERGGGLYIGGDGVYEPFNGNIIVDDQNAAAGTENQSFIQNTGTREGGGSGSGGGSSNLNMRYINVQNNYATYEGSGVYLRNGNAYLSNKTVIDGNNANSGDDCENLDVSRDNPQASSKDCVNFPKASGSLGSIISLGGTAAATAGSTAGTYVVAKWAVGGTLLALITGGIIAYFKSSGKKQKLDPDGGSPLHPEESDCTHKWSYSVRWGTNPGDAVTQVQKCSVCNGTYYMDMYKTVTDEEWAVTVSVTTSDGQKHQKKWSKYRLNRRANFPNGIIIPADLNLIDTSVYTVPENQPLTVAVGENKWKFDDEGLKFKHYTENGAVVETVTFNSSKREIDVDAQWKLPVKYEAGITVEEDKSLKDEMPDKIIFEEKGATHDVKKIGFKRDDYTSRVWIKSKTVRIEKEGNTYKLKYTYPDPDSDEDHKKPDSTLEMTVPVSMKAKWVTKWQAIGEELTEFKLPLFTPNKYKMDENVTALEEDKPNKVSKITINDFKKIPVIGEYELPADIGEFIKHEGELDLNGKTLDGKVKKKESENEGKGETQGDEEEKRIHHFDVSGKLTIKDTSDKHEGALINGSNDENGGSVSVKDEGKFEFDNGSIKDAQTKKSGGAVAVGKKSEFTFKDGKLTGNSAKENGGAILIASQDSSDDKGKATVSGGEITKNKADKSGGAVYVDKNGEFTISGGKLTENSAKENGGGVYIAGDAKLVMTGGEISGNTTEKNGGGVYVDGTFEVSGKVIIKDNNKKVKDEDSGAKGGSEENGEEEKKEANNVYLPKDKKITIKGKLDKDAKIHVRMEEPGVFTSGLKANDDEPMGTADNFVSDDDDYVVLITEEGEARLASKEHDVTIDRVVPTEGSVTADKEKAKKGDTVTVTVSYKDNYKLESIKVTYKEGNKDKECETTKTESGKDDIYTFEMPEADVLISVVYKSIGEKLLGYTLSLDDDIGVNFHMKIFDEEIIESSTAYIQFTVNNRKTQVKVADAEKNTEILSPLTTYAFRCSIYPKEMYDDITAQLIDGDRKGELYQFRAADYVRYILEHSGDGQIYSTEEAILARQMLVYGHYAQTYFGKKVYGAREPLDSVTLGQVYHVDNEEGLAEFKYDKSKAQLPDTIKFSNVRLSLESKTTLALYFTCNDELTITMDGWDDYTTGRTGTYQHIYIKNIKAEDLGRYFTVKINDGTDTYTVEYSIMNYCYNVIKSKTQTDNMKNVARSLYSYYMAAVDYTSKDKGGKN